MCSVGVRNEGHFARIRLHVRAREMSELTDILNIAITFTLFYEKFYTSCCRILYYMTMF